MSHAKPGAHDRYSMWWVT